MSSSFRCKGVSNISNSSAEWRSSYLLSTAAGGSLSYIPYLITTGFIHWYTCPRTTFAEHSDRATTIYRSMILQIPAMDGFLSRILCLLHGDEDLHLHIGGWIYSYGISWTLLSTGGADGIFPTDILDTSLYTSYGWIPWTIIGLKSLLPKSKAPQPSPFLHLFVPAIFNQSICINQPC